MKDWMRLQSEADFYNVMESSGERPQIIFKDSVTCGISAHADARLREGYALIEGKADFHYLDLLAFRSVSNLIAQTLGVTHQSPQIIVLKDRQVVYSASHHAINTADIARYL